MREALIAFGIICLVAAIDAVFQGNKGDAGWMFLLGLLYLIIASE